MKFEDVVGFLSSFHRATMVSLGVPTARFGHLDDNDWVRWMAPQDLHFRREKKHIRIHQVMTQNTSYKYINKSPP